MKTLSNNNEEVNNSLLKKLTIYLTEFKKKLFENMEDDGEKIEKILPLFHIILNAFTCFKFTNREYMEKLAAESHEFRMLPLPYGLIPHEVIEVIDNEKVLHGITKIFKYSEDFP
jgi:hypothetical protein